MRLTDHCLTLTPTTALSTDGECGVLKDEMLVAEEKEIGRWEIPHIPQGERMSNRWDNVDDYLFRRRNGGYMPADI